MTKTSSHVGPLRCSMVYRSAPTAVDLEIQTQRAENARLRGQIEALVASRQEATAALARGHHQRATRHCLSCGGSILPVAMFAGHDAEKPVPLQVSTARFCKAGGGFRGSAVVQARACGRCGLLHTFLAQHDPVCRDDETTSYVSRWSLSNSLGTIRGDACDEDVFDEW